VNGEDISPLNSKLRGNTKLTTDFATVSPRHQLGRVKPLVEMVFHVLHVALKAAPEPRFEFGRFVFEKFRFGNAAEGEAEGRRLWFLWSGSFFGVGSRGGSISGDHNSKKHFAVSGVIPVLSLDTVSTRKVINMVLNGWHSKVIWNCLPRKCQVIQ
jgi:hypothetical protein